MYTKKEKITTLYVIEIKDAAVPQYLYMSRHWSCASCPRKCLELIAQVL